MKRLISWVLCVAMILSLTTNVFALDASDIEVKDDVDAGFIKISVVANGSTYQKSPYNTSFISNIVINKDGSWSKDDSIYSYDIDAKWKGNQIKVKLPDGTEGLVQPEIRLWVAKDEEQAKFNDYENKIAKKEQSQSVNVHLDNPKDIKTNYVWYLYADAVNPLTGEVLASDRMSIDVTTQYKKLSTIHYGTVGIQVRYLDKAYPLGPYDYYADWGKQVLRTDGENNWFVNGDGGTYKGMDGYSYSDCYFDVDIRAEKEAVNAINNMEEVMKRITLMQTKASEIVQSGGKCGWKMKDDYIILSGPAYCEGRAGKNGPKVYNMAFYEKKKDENLEKHPTINTYANWGANTRDSFYTQRRWVSVQVPALGKGIVTINYFDEDTGKKIKESDIRKTTDYRLPDNIFKFEQIELHCKSS